MKNWKRILNALCFNNNWIEECPSQDYWSFKKNKLRCIFNWNSKTFRFILPIKKAIIETLSTW